MDEYYVSESEAAANSSTAFKSRKSVAAGSLRPRRAGPLRATRGSRPQARARGVVRGARIAF